MREQEELQQELQEIVAKVSKYLNEDEIALLNWACGLEKRETWREVGTLESGSFQ